MDLVLGAHASRNPSVLQDQRSDRARITWKTRFRSQERPGITWGVNGNAMRDEQGIFFLFADADSAFYQPFGGPLDSTATTTMLQWTYQWLMVDPWINIHTGPDDLHSIRTRWYETGVSYSDTTSGRSRLFNLDYLYHHDGEHWQWTAGASGYSFQVDDFQLGEHQGLTGGVFLQAERHLARRWSLQLGVREEFYLLDSLSLLAVPILKGGLAFRWSQPCAIPCWSSRLATRRN